MKTIESQLADTPIFQGVNLAPYAARLRDWCHVYEDGQVLCEQGEVSDRFIVLLSGTVRITDDATHILMRRAPELIGELALAGGPSVRTATITATGLVRTVEVPLSLSPSFLGDPRFTENLLKILAAKVAQATADRAEHYGNENKLIAAFNSHLSRDLTAQLLSSGKDYGTPRRIKGTVLFSDIRGFTGKSQLIDPEILAEQLGAYFEEMVKILHHHGAFVDKFIGDAVMAFWGLPSNSPEDPSISFSCAEKMIKRAACQNLAGEPISIGVGIAMGDVFCGNVGSDSKRQFTVLGPAVNLSARCESFCRDLGNNIVMSEAVYQHLRPEQQARCSPRLYPVKGFGELNLYTSNQKDELEPEGGFRSDLVSKTVD
jgi:class 3 adenylate cyclase